MIKLHYLDFKKLSIKTIVRISESTLIVTIDRFAVSRAKITYCIEKLTDDTSKLCSTSNIFNQLTPGSIYNISIIIHRDSFQNIFLWKKHEIFTLVNTSKSNYILLIMLKVFLINIKKIHHHYGFILGNKMDIVLQK